MGRLAVKAKKALEATARAANTFPPKIHVAAGVQQKETWDSTAKKFPGKFSSYKR